MRILFVHKQVLFPHDTGGKIRALNIVRHLARWHELTYLCNLRPGEEPQAEAMRDLGLRLEAVPHQAAPRRSPRFFRDLSRNLISAEPFAVARNYDPALRARAAELAAGGQFDLAICDTVQMAKHLIGPFPAARVLFQHNVEARILGRHAAAASSLIMARYMELQWRRMCRFEASCGPHFDAVIAVSEPDLRAFRDDYGWDHVHAIETSVDLDYYTPAPASLAVPGRVTFVGSMDWLPNEDGVLHFAGKIWPAIRRKVPSASFQVVGRHPPRSVARLSGTDAITILGGVPDVRPHLAEAEVVVVPLLVGGGTRLKIYEAMAMGKAVVSTSIGAEGLPVVPNEHLILADGPADFAAAVAGLLADPARRAALGGAACRFVAAHSGTEPIARDFDRICQLAVEASGRRAS